MDAKELLAEIVRNDMYRRDVVLHHYGESKEELDNNLIKKFAILGTAETPLPFDIPQGDYYCRNGEPLSDNSDGYKYPATPLEPDHKISVTDGHITRTYHLYRID